MPLGPYFTSCYCQRHRKRRIVDDKVDRDNFVSRMGQIAHETETEILFLNELDRCEIWISIGHAQANEVLCPLEPSSVIGRDIEG